MTELDTSEKDRDCKSPQAASLASVKNELTRQLLLDGSRDGLFETYGTSMKPLLSEGNLVAVRSCRLCDVKLGDVVLLNHDPVNNKYLVHRVIRKEGRGGDACLITKGDSSPRDLQKFTEADCLGKVRVIYQDGYACRIHEGIWVVINRLVAWLSFFSSLFVDGYPLVRKKDFRRQVIPQKIANSILKRLVKIGKKVTRYQEDTPRALSEGNG